MANGNGHVYSEVRIHYSIENIDKAIKEAKGLRELAFANYAKYISRTDPICVTIRFDNRDHRRDFYLEALQTLNFNSGEFVDKIL
jgi:hypothetical protein